MDTYAYSSHMQSTNIAYIKATQKEIAMHSKEIILEFLKLNQLALKKPGLIDKYAKDMIYESEVYCPLRNGNVISFEIANYDEDIKVQLHTEVITLIKKTNNSTSRV